MTNKPRKVSVLGDVAEVLREHGEKMLLVRFTGKNTEGHFNGKRNLFITVLKVCCDELPA